MSKSDELTLLYERYKAEFEGEQIVFGDGNHDSRIMLIGEAPGKDEVLKGKPFVGAAGKNLSEFLSVLDMEREDIFISNAIKFRLSKVNPDSGRISNRPATKQEIEQNRGYLLKEIEIINPEYIVTLGNVPLRAVYGDYGITIGDMHGKLYSFNIGVNIYNVFPLYHPASIIYNAKLKEVYYEDLAKLKQVMDGSWSNNE